jgi:catechol 2,3-dioxygenase-like lactoylglutathione lyase family enzyme
MKIKLTSVMVDDQDRALKFYTEVLGFVKKRDEPVGAYKWLTVVSPEGPDEIELLLEPNANPLGRTFQKGLYEQGIPATIFFVDDVEREYKRLKALGVRFTSEPEKTAYGTNATFDDTCGNLISLHQD